VGASDELAKGQSTFMVEMTETARILNTASEHSLVILDEIGRGTSTYDGVSLAWAIVEYLHNTISCRTLFATHYHELTDLANTNEAVSNLNVAVRERDEDVVFLHRIVKGAADKSYGIHVAQLAGVPTSVNDRAKAILKWLESKHVDEATNSEAATAPSTQSGQYQLTLFETADHPLLDEIRGLAVEECSPLDALVKIRNWQAQLSDDAKPARPR
jgi:DNA mismatch repair protein MutS